MGGVHIDVLKVLFDVLCFFICKWCFSYHFSYVLWFYFSFILLWQWV